jgi:DNA-binding Lrp family transcriptional regulator
VAEGHSDEAIAQRLGLDPPAVAERVEHLFRTFGVEEKPDDVRRVLSVLTVLRS